MNIRSIDKKDYSFVIDLDSGLYPTDYPADENIVHSWFSKYPEFGIIFEE